VVQVHVAPVLRLRAVLSALGYMAGVTEKLAELRFCNQVIPGLGEVRTDAEVLALGIYVIKLKVFHGPAADALAAKHGDKTLASLALLGLDVRPEVLGTPGHQYLVKWAGGVRNPV
jgi:hypothetical protein